MDIIPAGQTQQNLFVQFDHMRHEKLMEAVDRINLTWGSETIRSGASGYERLWRMKRASLSNRFTTSWDEVLTVRT